MLHHPMGALIALFTHVLKAPGLSTVPSDVMLLDMAAGYFGHLGLISSSELSFPFARGVTDYARKVINRAEESAEISNETAVTSRTVRTSSSYSENVGANSEVCNSLQAEFLSMMIPMISILKHG